jgi:hypothetical protein
MTTPYDQDEQEDGIVVANPRRKGGGGATYELVALSGVEEQAEEDGLAITAAAGVTEKDTILHQHDDEPRWQSCLSRTLLSDTCFAFRDLKILDGVEAVRFWKFLCLTAFTIALVHFVVRWADMEHDNDYTLSDLVLYDGNGIIFDMVVYFTVARMFSKRGVDHLGWFLPALVGSLYPSWIMNFSFLRYSVSLYEIHCLWPASLWFYVVFVVTIVATLVCKHIQYAVRHCVFVVKLVEATMTVLLLLVPQISHPNFHFHHWFAGLLIGMHCNYDTWWSRMCCAYCWGLYINGIAVYGRDATLTCAYGFFVSVDSGCPFLQCFLTEQAAASNETHTSKQDYQPMEEPDWRNCSGYTP